MYALLNIIQMETLGCGPSCVILRDRNRATVTWIVKWKADLRAAAPIDTATSDIPLTHFNQESRPKWRKSQHCSQSRPSHKQHYSLGLLQKEEGELSGS